MTLKRRCYNSSIFRTINRPLLYRTVQSQSLVRHTRGHSALEQNDHFTAHCKNTSQLRFSTSNGGFTLDWLLNIFARRKSKSAFYLFDLRRYTESVIQRDIKWVQRETIWRLSSIVAAYCVTDNDELQRHNAQSKGALSLCTQYQVSAESRSYASLFLWVRESIARQGTRSRKRSIQNNLPKSTRRKRCKLRRILSSSQCARGAHLKPSEHDLLSYFLLRTKSGLRFWSSKRMKFKINEFNGNSSSGGRYQFANQFPVDATIITNSATSCGLWQLITTQKSKPHHPNRNNGGDHIRCGCNSRPECRSRCNLQTNPGVTSKPTIIGLSNFNAAQICIGGVASHTFPGESHTL
jgi:hypothetical protein